MIPAARGTTVREARPALADAPEPTLDFGDELVHDRVAPGALARAVHGIRIVVVRRRVLDLDEKHAREVGTRPVEIELVGQLLLDAVVTVDIETLAVFAFEIGGGRLGYGEILVEVDAIAVVDVLD